MLTHAWKAETKLVYVANLKFKQLNNVLAYLWELNVCTSGENGNFFTFIVEFWFWLFTGPRLNATKDHKTSITYAKDFRLELNVVPPMPKLEVKLSGLPESEGKASVLPESLHQGEVKKISLQLTNTGGRDLCYLHLVKNLIWMYI